MLFAMLAGVHPLGAQTAGTIVRGVAFDSLRGVALRGALVALGTNRSAITDSAGRFSFDGVPSGAHLFTVQHDAIDSLGFSDFSRRVTIGATPASIVVGVPSFATLWRETCGGAPSRDSGFVSGSVVDARTTKPIANATVILTIDDVRTGGRLRRVRSETRSNTAGGYTICGVPTKTPLQLRAVTDSFDAIVEVPASVSRVHRRLLAVGPPAQIAAAEPPPVPAPAPPRRSGLAAFAAVVTDTLRKPLTGVQVSFADIGRSGLTNERGEVRFADVPSGEHQLTARRFGYAPAEARITFAGEQTVQRRIVLEPVARLDSVVTSATSAALTEFEENRRLGLGHFITRAELAKQESRKLSEILRQVMSVGLITGSGGQAWLVSTRAAGSTCSFVRTAAERDRCLRQEGRIYVPENFERSRGVIMACYGRVYLDKFLMNPGHPTEPFDVNTVHPDDVEAIEYYGSASETPARYASLNGGCGLMVLHMRRSRE